MSRTDPPRTQTSPQDVRRKNFTVRLRGLDKGEVRFFMAGLADDLKGLQAQVAALTLENDSLRAELSEPPARYAWLAKSLLSISIAVRPMVAGCLSDGSIGRRLIDGPGLDSRVQGTSTSGRGVAGFSTSGTGVRGESSSLAGVYGECLNPDPNSVFSFGGVFVGGIKVTGDIISNGKAFQIDHPLDPQNKYLMHACVESSERKNVYDGVVRLDNDRAVWVELPEWFEV